MVCFLYTTYISYLQCTAVCTDKQGLLLGLITMGLGARCRNFVTLLRFYGKTVKFYDIITLGHEGKFTIPVLHVSRDGFA